MGGSVDVTGDVVNPDAPGETGAGGASFKSSGYVGPALAAA